MRLILDEGFPQFVENYGIADLELIRWRNDPDGDIDFLRKVAREGFTGVIFLGMNVIGSKEFADELRAAKTKVFVTYNTDPFAASIDIANQLRSIRHFARTSGVHVIYAREVRPVDNF